MRFTPWNDLVTSLCCSTWIFSSQYWRPRSILPNHLGALKFSIAQGGSRNSSFEVITTNAMELPLFCLRQLALKRFEHWQQQHYNQEHNHIDPDYCDRDSPAYVKKGGQSLHGMMMTSIPFQIMLFFLLDEVLLWNDALFSTMGHLSFLFI